MSLLRDRMTRDMERAGLAPSTIDDYLRAVRSLAKLHRKAPDQLEQDDIRTWDEHLLELGLSPSTRLVYHAAVKFLFRRTLFRPDMVSCLIRPRVVSKLPRVLSPAEVGRLLAALREPRYRTFFSLIYDTGLRVSEAAHLRIGDLDRISCWPTSVAIHTGLGSRIHACSASPRRRSHSGPKMEGPSASLQSPSSSGSSNTSSPTGSKRSGTPDSMGPPRPWPPPSICWAPFPPNPNRFSPGKRPWPPSQEGMSPVVVTAVQQCAKASYRPLHPSWAGPDDQAPGAHHECDRSI